MQRDILVSCSSVIDPEGVECVIVEDGGIDGIE